MRKFAVAAAAAVALMSSAAPAGATAGEVAPCATQQALFDKYGIGLNMDAPLVGYVYGTVCSVTG